LKGVLKGGISHFTDLVKFDISINLIKKAITFLL